MLTQICIRDFAIIHRLEQDLQPGMTALTGETGAGKSIIVDALGLTLGGRARARALPPGVERAEVSAVFSLEDAAAAAAWLAERDLSREDECLLRRTINAEGRSRAWINGQPCPVQDLQELGALLAAIHGQHANLTLLRQETQRDMLDAFGNLAAQAQKAREQARRWQELGETLQRLQSGRGDGEARKELLQYQVSELERLSVNEEEIQSLEEEHQRLASADQLRALCSEALATCDEQELSATALLGQGIRALEEASKADGRLQEALELLADAQSRGREAASVLGRCLDDFQEDPQRLALVEERMQAIHQAARRHKVESRELPALCRQLQEELQLLEKGGDSILHIQQEREESEREYRRHARVLSGERARCAKSLAEEVDRQLQALDMHHCRFEAHLVPREKSTPASGGDETVQFLVRTNPGHPAGPLEQVASGGELSRIGLALQVATLGKTAPPTLVFDEVDSGIGSSAAAQVGALLHQLGERGQTLCVTHLAQVAGQADHHLVADKEIGEGSTRATLRTLSGEDERVEEIARLITGRKITGKSRVHAREILQRKSG